MTSKSSSEHIEELKAIITGLQQRRTKDAEKIRRLKERIKAGAAWYANRDLTTIQALEQKVKAQREVINTLQEALERRYR